MRHLRPLPIGARFRVARRIQEGLNGVLATRDQVLKVRKIYLQAPYVRVCEGPGGTVTLLPETPVLFPREPDPSDAEVAAFATTRVRPNVVGHVVRWDGCAPLGHLTPQARTIVMVLLAFLGYREFSRNEALQVLGEEFKKYCKSKQGIATLWAFYRPRLVKAGLLAEILGEQEEVA